MRDFTGLNKLDVQGAARRKVTSVTDWTGVESRSSWRRLVCIR
ncbi:MAG: hypothetical protein NTX45_12705 [Proteobacteria bacterium]|nr:hypothetical protein [Pseudomonadota bacterium]